MLHEMSPAARNRPPNRGNGRGSDFDFSEAAAAGGGDTSEAGERKRSSSRNGTSISSAGTHGSHQLLPPPKPQPDAEAEPGNNWRVGRHRRASTTQLPSITGGRLGSGLLSGEEDDDRGSSAGEGVGVGNTGLKPSGSSKRQRRRSMSGAIHRRRSHADRRER